MQIKKFALIAIMTVALPGIAQSGSGTQAKTGLYKATSVDAFMAAVDKNHDGKITKPEWTEGANLPRAAFVAIEPYLPSLTKDQLLNHPYPPEALDSNGALTIEGMRTYGAMLHGFDLVVLSPKNVDKFMDEVDTNHDGKITAEEWKAAGLMEGYFHAFDDVNKSPKGYLTKDDVLHLHLDKEMLLPDGSLTLESMKAYDALHHPGGRMM